MPHLWEHLTAYQWDDGSFRTPSTLTVFYEGGRCKLCLNNRAECATGWVSGDSLHEAMKAMDEALSLGKLDWRKNGRRNGLQRS
jgi:hypothetical protein